MSSDVEVVVPESAAVTRMAPVDGGLAVEQQREAGLNALARMSEAEFAERLRSLRMGLERFDALMREVLTTGKGPNFDLMVVEGVEKPVFTQSAAEKTCFVARLCPSFTVERVLGVVPRDATPEEAAAQPAISYTVRCNLHLGNLDGPVVAQGVGSANSHERKYRWRHAEKHCPECGVTGALLKSKHKDDRGPFAGTTPWFCWGKKGGCGAKFALDDKRITEQRLGMVENPDPFDLDNTLLKMAKKRAHVDATKTATCASGRVTQDLEEGQPGSVDATEARAQVYERARRLGWTTFGQLMEAARQYTGKPVRSKEQFEQLTATDYAMLLERMPQAPVNEKHEAEQPLPEAPQPSTEGGEPQEVMHDE